MTLRERLDDERGIVVSFVVKLVVISVVVGVTVIDGGSILFARLRAQDTAETAASVAASAYESTSDVGSARAAAEQAIADKDGTVRLLPGDRGIEVLEDGSVEVTVKKRASTLLVERIGFLEDLEVARATAVGQPPPV